MSENQCVGLASKVLYDLGSEYVEGVNAISGERCNPHPHVFSDRVLRPGDPAYFDILHSYMGYRTCYYRTFSIGYASHALVDAYQRCREYLDAAIALVRPGRTTGEIACVWPKAQEFGFPNEEAASACNSATASASRSGRSRSSAAWFRSSTPYEIKPGMVFALETFWPSTDGWSAARIEEEIVVTETGHEVITRFPAEKLLVAGPALLHRQRPASRHARDRVRAQPARHRNGGGQRGSGNRRSRARADRNRGGGRLMAVSVVMPALELAQESGKLIAWLKQEGDAVAKGEMIAEIETDKAVFELEAPAAGVLAGVKSNAGDMVPVGRTIAWIVARGETPPAEEDPATRAMAAQARQSTPASAVAPAPAAAPATASQERPLRASPKARRIAEEHGVDLSQIRGTGPDGAITAEDVLAAAAAPKPVTAVPAPAMSAVARLMAERTTQSWTQTPHFFLVRDVDADGLIEARKALGEGFTITDLLISVTARVLSKHPKLNASWTPAGIRLNPEVNMTIAVAVEDGVAGAVIPNAHSASLAEIAEQRKQLAERARAGRLRPSDVSGGTFTISNLGMFHVDAFSAIITPPQAAILAVGRIADRVVPVNGAPGIRPMLTLTLSSDHRIVDGAQAARFLNALREALEAPQGVINHE